MSEPFSKVENGSCCISQYVVLFLLIIGSFRLWDDLCVPLKLLQKCDKHDTALDRWVDLDEYGNKLEVAALMNQEKLFHLIY